MPDWCPSEIVKLILRGTTMSIEEENKTLVRRLYELLERKDMDAAYRYFVPEFVFHSPAGDMSLDQMKQADINFYRAFPDMKVAIEEIIADEDMVSVRVNYRGTHQREFLGVAPTRKKLDITNSNTLRIVAGKFVEGWNVTDIRLVQQIGAIPYNKRRAK
jgi:predicted ester cyclase